MKGSYNLIPIQDLLDTSLPDDSTKQTLRGGEYAYARWISSKDLPVWLKTFLLKSGKKEKKGKSQGNCTSYSSQDSTENLRATAQVTQLQSVFNFKKLIACVLVNLLSTANETKSNMQRRPAESQTNQKRSKSSWFDSLSRKYMCIINSVVSIWVQIVTIKRDL